MGFAAEGCEERECRAEYGRCDGESGKVRQRQAGAGVGCVAAQNIVFPCIDEEAVEAAKHGEENCS